MGLLSTLILPLGPWTQQLSTPVLLAVSAITFTIVAVVVNVLQQILFKDRNKPPMVFHFFPFFGSTVVYGMDPYAFFSANQEKVFSFPSSSLFLPLTRRAANIATVRRCVYLCDAGQKDDGVPGP